MVAPLSQFSFFRRYFDVWARPCRWHDRRGARGVRASPSVSTAGSSPPSRSRHQRATTPHGSRVSIVSHVPRPVSNISFFMNKFEFSRRKHEKIVHTCMYIHTRIAQTAHEKRFVREQKTRTRTLAARPPAAEPPAARAVQLGHHAVPAAREQREQHARRSAQARHGPMERGPSAEARAAPALPRRAQAALAVCRWAARHLCAPCSRALPLRPLPQPIGRGPMGSHGVRAPGSAEAVAPLVAPSPAAPPLVAPPPVRPFTQ